MPPAPSWTATVSLLFLFLSLSLSLSFSLSLLLSLSFSIEVTVTQMLFKTNHTQKLTRRGQWEGHSVQGSFPPLTAPQ